MRIASVLVMVVNMVRVHLYESTVEGYKVPLFRTVLVGFTEFKRLLEAGVVVRVGVQYAMVDKFA